MPSERDVIRIFQQNFGIKYSPSQNDDIERVRINDTNLAINIDTLVYDTDVPPRMSLREAARKSMVACVSDFAAKGARPLQAVISVNIPPTYDTSDFEEISGGLADASAEFNCKIVGGDTKQATPMSITVCILGKGRDKPRRDGARIGDAVFVSGPFGLTAAGLHALLNGHTQGADDNMIKSILHPTVPLEFGIKIADYITASMDSSDGLSTTLNEISTQSGVSIIVTNEPIADNVQEFAKKNSLNINDLVYDGGEEYEIVFTAPEKHIPKIRSISLETDTPLIHIGFVQEGRGVFVGKNGQSRRVYDQGWDAIKMSTPKK